MFSSAPQKPYYTSLEKRFNLYEHKTETKPKVKSYIDWMIA
jgi:hypothetical protein